MFDSILNKMQEKVRMGEFIMTVHAEEEMNDEDLSIFDVEKCIFNGKIVERQKDTETSESKYRILCTVPSEIEIIAKLSVTGKLVIITVYSL